MKWSDEMKMRCETVGRMLLLLAGAVLFAFGCSSDDTAANTDDGDGGNSSSKSDSDDVGVRFEDVDESPTPKQVSAVLLQYLESLESSLPSEILTEVRKYAESFPIEAENSEAPVAVTIADNETADVRVDIARRDWAYAHKGVEYTFRGGTIEGDAELLNVALWCFVEAALLNLDEPDHLANVGFLLNQQGRWEDALTVLRFALSLDALSTVVVNNLAFLYASTGQLHTAISFQMQAAANWPGDRHLALQLANYLERADASIAADAIDSTFGVAGAYDFSDVPFSAPTTDDVGDMMSWVDNEAASAEQLLDAAKEKYQRKEDTLNSSQDVQRDSITATAAECMVDIMMQGWDSVEEQFYHQCLRCDIPQFEAGFGLLFEFYHGALSIWREYEAEGARIISEKMIAAQTHLESLQLSSDSDDMVWQYIYTRLMSENADSVFGKVESIRLLLAAAQMELKPIQQAGCGPAPVGELTHVKERDIACEMFPYFCKKWAIWFGVGSFSWDPNGLCELSLGNGIQAKLGYNFGTDSVSIGAGYGINLGPLSPGASVRFSRAKGLEGSVELEPSKPFFLTGPVSAPGTSVAKFVSFFN